MSMRVRVKLGLGNEGSARCKGMIGSKQGVGKLKGEWLGMGEGCDRVETNIGFVYGLGASNPNTWAE